jgi:hypothetical protein
MLITYLMNTWTTECNKIKINFFCKQISLDNLGLWITQDMNPVISEPIKGTTAINMKVGKKQRPRGPSSQTSDFFIAFKTSFR